MQIKFPSQERRTANAIMDYIVVPALPRKALVEWQVWIHTHNNKFECNFNPLTHTVSITHDLLFPDEETGCTVANQYLISIRRRWNYENNCAAIICYVSTGGLIQRCSREIIYDNGMFFRSNDVIAKAHGFN